MFLVKYNNSFQECNQTNSMDQMISYKAHRKSYCLVIKIESHKSPTIKTESTKILKILKI